jgi:transmembrane sensor
MMSEIHKLRTRVEIDEEAATWAWRLDANPVSAAEQSAFDSWLRRDPRHRRAYDELSAVWNALDGLAEAKRDEKIATFSVKSQRFMLHGRGRWWAAAAALLLVVLGGTMWLQRGNESQTLATAVGQQRNVTLADGSIVTLNTNTIVETNLRRHVREIYLRKGEAHFQVAHDRSRPFLVHAGDAVVRAVGTQFEVRLMGDSHVDVVVNEGRVEVQSTPVLAAAANPTGSASPKHSLAPARVHTLAAGQELSSQSGDYAVIPVSTVELSSALAWREGAIVFEGQPLSQAIAEIERYTDARIVISDAQTADMRVGGRFRTGDIQEFFDALQTALPVSVRRASNGVIFIEARR